MKKITRRDFLQGSAALTLSAAFSGVIGSLGVSAEESAIPAYADIVLGEDYTDLTASVRFIHNMTNREEDGTMASFVEAFNEMYPNITLTTDGITDFAEDALLRLSAGDWGEVMFIPAVDKDEYANYFYPFGTVDEMSELINFANTCAYDGICYGVPCYGSTQGMVYNKAVFEAAGVTELPKTPDEFIAALQAIKDNTDAIPLYTNYAAGWTMGAWDAYIGIVSDGDAAYYNQKFVHDAEPFSDHGDGTGAYALYKILYDAVANGLIEEDYSTTDWESCKGMINNGEIGCMVLGSWAYVQMVEAGENGDDIGYMPFPISVDGQQYVAAAGNYSYGISSECTGDTLIASLIFVKWMTEQSGWCDIENEYPTDANGELPAMYSAFDGCTSLSNEDALAGEETLLDDMNSESELSFNAGGNTKIQRIVESAFTGAETFDEIMADWTATWNEAQEYLGIETTTY